MYKRQGEVTSKTVNILRESGSRVAVNGNQNSEYVKSFGSVSPDFFEFFTFTPHVEDKGDFNVTDYTAQMAKSAKELALSLIHIFTQRAISARESR